MAHPDITGKKIERFFLNVLIQQLNYLLLAYK